MSHTFSSTIYWVNENYILGKEKYFFSQCSNQVVGWKTEKKGYISGKDRNYSLLYIIQTSSGIKPAPYPVDTELLSPGCKVARV